MAVSGIHCNWENHFRPKGSKYTNWKTKLVPSLQPWKTTEKYSFFEGFIIFWHSFKVFWQESVLIRGETKILLKSNENKRRYTTRTQAGGAVYQSRLSYPLHVLFFSEGYFWRTRQNPSAHGGQLTFRLLVRMSYLRAIGDSWEESRWTKFMTPWNRRFVQSTPFNKEITKRGAIKIVTHIKSENPPCLFLQKEIPKQIPLGDKNEKTNEKNRKERRA